MNRVELAVNTDYAGEKKQLEQVRAMLGRIAEAGFTHIHWCHEWEGDYVYSVYEMRQIREWMDELGLKAKALHATKGSSRDVNVREGHYRKDYTSNWEYNRKAGVEQIKNRVDMAAILGAGEIVLHLYVPHLTIRSQPEAKEDFYECVCRSLDELMPYCMEKKVKICLENLFDMPGEDMLEVWDRLYAVHIHDNNGDADSHRIPGEGNIDWNCVMDMLAGSAYEGPLLLELVCNEKNEDEYLKKAYEAGCRLAGIYQP